MRLEGSTVLVLGRLRGVRRERLAELIAAAGGRLARRASARVTLLCFAHSTAMLLEQEPAISLPAVVPTTCSMISELTLRRFVGLAPPPAPENRTLGVDEVARQSGLTVELIRFLALYDVLEPEGGSYGYRDLLAAREASRLLKEGLPLGDIVQAVSALRRSGRSLSDTRLREAPWGEMLQEVAGRLGRLDGQLALPFTEAFESVDELLERAERLEEAGDLDEAEKLYRIAIRIDRTDPVLPFNLGNILDAQHRTEEAVIAYQQAIACDPGFAEAWVNLGLVREHRGDPAGARECYARAMGARPNYPDALFNLALLLTRGEDYDAALPLWDRFLESRPGGKDAQHARRLVTLCRMQATGRRSDVANS
jgi:tetratricopeptide (TPR) repeat protein